MVRYHVFRVVCFVITYTHITPGKVLYPKQVPFLEIVTTLYLKCQLTRLVSLIYTSTGEQSY